MLGAIIGDTVGSVFEFNNTKDVNFPLFSSMSSYTDDSLMSLAVAKWLTIDRTFSHKVLEESMVGIASDYDCPMGGYGGGFRRWLFVPDHLYDYSDGTKCTERRPYNSWGNGSAMRVSAVGWMFDTLEETERVAELSASITHNHPEGIKGAQATAAAIFMARTGSTKEEIRNYIQKRFGYDLTKTWSDIHPTYGWEDSCQGTVPPAIIAFLDSENFEDAIRLAVALGGDSDTLACITGGIAEAYYKELPQEMIDETWARLNQPLRNILESFAASSRYGQQYSTYKKYMVGEYFTPPCITELRDNEVFVFGSNLAGHHCGGAARVARKLFGAKQGQGVGLQGQSYAIPTMQGGVDTIKPYVDEFIEFARQHPELTFYVTRIGCGIAGFTDDQIAPLFKAAENMMNVIIPKSFFDVLAREESPTVERFAQGLDRFHEAQAAHYQTALKEIKDGYKYSHWMWFIFPQIKGLGKSATSQYYEISCLDEAKAYIDDDVLGGRLREMCGELLKHSDRSVQSILGGIDSMKLKSSMTLFDIVSPNDVFDKVLDIFYFGERDNLTLEIINLPF